MASTKTASTVREAVAKVVGARKSGSSFSKETFMSAVNKKLGHKADEETALRSLRATQKTTYNYESGTYVVR